MDDQERWGVGMHLRDRRGLAEDLRMAVDLALDHHALQEVDEPVALGGGAVLPVVAAVDADDGVDRGVRALGQVGLHLGIVGGQAGQRRQVATCRTARYRNEIAVAAEPVDVGARPRDRGLHIGDVLRPAVVRRHPVVHRQAHPALLGQIRHQRVALQLPAAVDPCAAGNEDHHRRRLDGQFLGAPHVQQLRRVVAVANRGAVQAAAVLPHLQHRRVPLRRGPLDRQVGGGHDAAQRRLDDGVGRVAAPACESSPGRRLTPRPCAIGDTKSGHVAVSPDAHRGRSTKGLKAFPDDRQRRRRNAHRQQIVGRTGAEETNGRDSTRSDAGCRLSGRSVIAPNVPRYARAKRQHSEVVY